MNLSKVDVETSRPEPAPGQWSRLPAPRKKLPLFPKLLIGSVSFALVVFALLTKPILIPYALLPLTFLFILSEALNEPSPRPTPEDLQLLESEDDREVCLVAIKIFRNGKLVGRDRGVVWFAEGQLLFNGHGTSFIIGGEDILPSDGKSLTENKVLLRVREGTAKIEFRPLVILGQGVANPQEMRFIKHLYDFLHHPPTSNGPRQWPPFEQPPALSKK